MQRNESIHNILKCVDMAIWFSKSIQRRSDIRRLKRPVCLCLKRECVYSYLLIIMIFPQLIATLGQIPLNLKCRLNRGNNLIMRNPTVTIFILLGLTDDPQLKTLIFIFLFLTYVVSMTGNLMIISLTYIDSHLKTAMYFFLQNFSFLEISFTTACIPRYLYNISTGDKTITYNNCAIQIFCTDLFGVTEFFLLAIMSFDW